MRLTLASPTRPLPIDSFNCASAYLAPEDEVNP